MAQPDHIPTATPRSSIWHVIPLLLATFGGVYLAYVVGAHVYLNGPWFKALVNPPGSEVQVSFGVAESLWPGTVEATSLAVAGQHGGGLSWRVEAGHARVLMDFLALRRQTIRLTSLTGDDVRVLFRTGRKLPPAARAAQPELPDLVLRPDESPKASGEAWTIRLEEILLRRLTEVWVDEVRYTGGANLAGSLVVGGGQVAVPRLEARFAPGELRVGSAEAVALSRLTLTGALRQIAPHTVTGDELGAALTARLAFAARVEGIGFLNTYLRSAPWLSLRRGAGALAADLRFERGTFAPGTRLVVTSETLEIVAFGQRARGRGRATLRVSGPRDAARLSLALSLPRYTLGNARRETAPVEGERLRLDVTGPNPALGQPLRQWRSRLRLPQATVRDLTYLNDFLPRGAPLRVVGGKGRLEAVLFARVGVRPDVAASVRQAGQGHVGVKGENVQAMLAGTSVEGDLDASLSLVAVDPARGWFDVAGSRVDLKRVTTEAGKDRQTDWWARLTFPEARAKVTEPAKFEGRAQFAGKNLRPLIAAVSQKEGLPGWVQGALAFDGVEASAGLVADERSFRLTDGLATAKGIRLDGWYDKTGEDAKARLLARYGVLTVGLALDGDDLSWKLLGATSWYERQRPVSH